MNFFRTILNYPEGGEEVEPELERQSEIASESGTEVEGRKTPRTEDPAGSRLVVMNMKLSETVDVGLIAQAMQCNLDGWITKWTGSQETSVVAGRQYFGYSRYTGVGSLWMDLALLMPMEVGFFNDWEQRFQCLFESCETGGDHGTLDALRTQFLRTEWKLIRHFATGHVAVGCLDRHRTMASLLDSCLGHESESGVDAQTVGVESFGDEDRLLSSLSRVATTSSAAAEC